MNNNVKSVLKTESKVIAYIVICLVIIVLGVSYALFFQVKRNEKNQIVKAGTLEFSYENCSEITTKDNEDCFVSTNYDGAKKLTKCEYKVSITNSGTLPGVYTLTLKSIATDNPVGLDKLKVILKKEGTVVNLYPKTISTLSNGVLIENEKIPAGELINYTVQVYVDEETIKDTDDEKNIALQINGRAEVSTDEGINPAAPLPKGTTFLEQKEKEEQLKEEPQLIYDDTEDENLRYVGANPNNYIDIGDRDSAGNKILWRIIGVMKNVTNAETGIKEDLIKIIRADSIGGYSWDTSESKVNIGFGINEWSQADLMKLLNPESVYTKEGEIGNSLYWNNKSGQCYSDLMNSDEPCDFQSSGISEEAKNKIAKVKWNTGAVSINELEWTASAIYKAERGSLDGKQFCANNGSGFCNDNVDRTTKWDGYIGLMHPSDFGYAVGKSVREVCLAKSMKDYNIDGCKEVNWLTPSSDIEWTLNSHQDSSASLAISIYSDGYLASTPVSSGYNVRPVVYLKSLTTISDALGSPEDPFVAS